MGPKRRRRQWRGFDAARAFGALMELTVSPLVVICQCIGQARGHRVKLWRRRFIITVGLVSIAFAISLTSVRYTDRQSLESLSRSVFGDCTVSQTPYAEMINVIAKAHGLDAALVASIISIESGNRSTAVSNKSAKGLMQVMPGTWRDMMPESDCTGYHPPPAKEADCIYHPSTNIEAGCRYLVWLGKRCRGRAGKVLAAYNGGLGNADRNLRLVLQGDLRFETPAYVVKVLKEWDRRSGRVVGNTASGGLSPIAERLAVACALLWIVAIVAARTLWWR